MLIDYLEDATQELRTLEERLISLGREYQIMRDPETRDQMAQLKKELKKKKFQLLEYLYEHLQELTFLKKNFPEYVTVLLEEPSLSEILNRISWLFDYKELPSQECTQALLAIKKERKQLRDARDFLKKWVGPIDQKSLVATWPLLKGELRPNMDTDEIVAVIKKKNKELRKKGWLIMIHEPFIKVILDKISERIKALKKTEFEKQTELKKGIDQGIYKQETLLKERKKTEKERIGLERRFKHILLAGYPYLFKLKQQKTWREEKGDLFLSGLVRTIPTSALDEKLWLKEARKKLNL